MFYQMSFPTHKKQTNFKHTEEDSNAPVLTLQECLDLVESYLSESALFHHSDSTVEEQVPQIEEEGPDDLDPTSTTLIEVPPKLQRRKSVFHNFQKHLICLLRRHIEMNGLESQNKLADDLWSSFVASKCNNKKILNLVFGISSTRSREELYALAAGQPGFKRLIDSVPIEEVEEAQEVLRARVVEEAAQLDKAFLREHSNIGKFKEFYIYYEEFVVQLSQGPLLKRVSKKRRQQALQLIQNLE